MPESPVIFAIFAIIADRKDFFKGKVRDPFESIMYTK